MKVYTFARPVVDLHHVRFFCRPNLKYSYTVFLNSKYSYTVFLHSIFCECSGHYFACMFHIKVDFLSFFFCCKFKLEYIGVVQDQFKNSPRHPRTPILIHNFTIFPFFLKFDHDFVDHTYEKPFSTIATKKKFSKTSVKEKVRNSRRS